MHSLIICLHVFRFNTPDQSQIAAHSTEQMKSSSARVETGRHDLQSHQAGLLPFAATILVSGFQCAYQWV